MYKINWKNPFARKLGKEDIVQNAIVNYIEYMYGVICIPCNTEFNKNKFFRWKALVMGQRSATLDLFVPAAKNGYHGLFLELKSDGVIVFKKNGELRRNEHLEAQHETIKQHRSAGYKAEFATGLKQATEIVDEYFK